MSTRRSSYAELPAVTERKDRREMKRLLTELPTVVTSFAYRRDYFAELEGMLASVREHHPDWPVVVGWGPAPGFEAPTLEVNSPVSRSHWTLPVPLNLEGQSQNDWRKITMMKGWWISNVWRRFGDIGEGAKRRVLWLD